MTPGWERSLQNFQSWGLDQNFADVESFSVPFKVQLSLAIPQWVGGMSTGDELASLA